MVSSHLTYMYLDSRSEVISMLPFLGRLSPASLPWTIVVARTYLFVVHIAKPCHPRLDLGGLGWVDRGTGVVGVRKSEVLYPHDHSGGHIRALSLTTIYWGFSHTLPSSGGDCPPLSPLIATHRRSSVVSKLL